jgi:hypothetical protein
LLITEDDRAQTVLRSQSELSTHAVGERLPRSRLRSAN